MIKDFFFFSLFSPDELFLPPRKNRKVTCSHAYIVRFDKNFLLSLGSNIFPSTSSHLDSLMAEQKKKHDRIILLQEGLMLLFP